TGRTRGGFASAGRRRSAGECKAGGDRSGERPAKTGAGRIAAGAGGDQSGRVRESPRGGTVGGADQARRRCGPVADRGRLPQRGDRSGPGTAATAAGAGAADRGST